MRYRVYKNEGRYFVEYRKISWLPIWSRCYHHGVGDNGYETIENVIEAIRETVKYEKSHVTDISFDYVASS